MGSLWCASANGNHDSRLRSRGSFGWAVPGRLLAGSWPAPGRIERLVRSLSKNKTDSSVWPKTFRKTRQNRTFCLKLLEKQGCIERLVRSFSKNKAESSVWSEVFRKTRQKRGCRAFRLGLVDFQTSPWGGTLGSPKKCPTTY